MGSFAFVINESRTFIRSFALLAAVRASCKPFFVNFSTKKTNEFNVYAISWTWFAPESKYSVPEIVIALKLG